MKKGRSEGPLCQLFNCPVENPSMHDHDMMSIHPY